MPGTGSRDTQHDLTQPAWPAKNLAASKSHKQVQKDATCSGPAQDTFCWLILVRTGARQGRTQVRDHAVQQAPSLSMHSAVSVRCTCAGAADMRASVHQYVVHWRTTWRCFGAVIKPGGLLTAMT